MNLCLWVQLCRMCETKINYLFVYSDLCSSFGKNLLPLLSNATSINELVKEGKRSRIKRTKTLSTWAFKELKNLSS